MQCLFLFFVILLTGCTTPNPLDKIIIENKVTRVSPHYVGIQNGQLEYYRLGQGSPIVLIEGYVTDVSSWNKPFLVALAKNHELIVFNNRNVGRSHVKSNRYQSKDLAKDTHQLIQKLELKKPAVVGISMGGMIAQQLAVLYPNDIGQLILINTAIAGEESIKPTPDTEELMLNMPTNLLGRYLIALQLFFPESQRTEMGFALAFDRFQPKNYTEIMPESVVSQQRFLVLDWTKDNTTAKKLKKLNLPVLILNGAADKVIPPVNSEILAKTIPPAEFARWQNGGHAMIYQYPESISEVIHDFIIKQPTKNERSVS